MLLLLILSFVAAISAQTPHTFQFLWFSDFHDNTNGGDSTDSPTALVTKTIEDAYTNTPKSLKFILITGDFSAHHIVPKGQEGDSAKVAAARKSAAKTLNSTLNALTKKFGTTIPIVFSVGNNDFQPNYYTGAPQTASSSGGYVPNLQTETLGGDLKLNYQVPATLKEYGYYSLKVTSKLVVVMLNTVIYFANAQNLEAALEERDIYDQFNWLEETLLSARVAGRKVMITGHIPPVMDTYYDPTAASIGKSLWLPAYAQRFQILVALYQDVVTGLLFGHTHRNEMQKYPVSADTLVGMNGKQKWHLPTTTFDVPVLTIGSVSPAYGNLPSFKVVTCDADTGVVQDYQTWSSPNTNPYGYTKLYDSVKARYGMKDLSSSSVRDLSYSMLKGKPQFQDKDGKMWTSYLTDILTGQTDQAILATWSTRKEGILGAMHGSNPKAYFQHSYGDKYEMVANHGSPQAKLTLNSVPTADKSKLQQTVQGVLIGLGLVRAYTPLLIVSGTNEKAIGEDGIKTLFRDGIVPLSNTYNMAVINDGLKEGVTALMGETVALLGTTFPLLGICNKTIATQVGLSAYNTNFIVTGDQSTATQESTLIANVQKELAAGMAKLITLVINGNRNELPTVIQSLDMGASVWVVKGTGGLADLIASGGGGDPTVASVQSKSKIVELSAVEDIRTQIVKHLKGTSTDCDEKILKKCLIKTALASLYGTSCGHARLLKSCYGDSGCTAPSTFQIPDCKK